MPTADERRAVDFISLRLFARELAETWLNGNKTDVLETLSDGSRFNRVELALLIAEELAGTNVELAHLLHNRGWDG